MREEICEKIRELSPKVGISTYYNELLQLTKDLIDIYQQQGRLADDPFDSARLRYIDVPIKELNSMLDGSVCVVTGGNGCVGSALIIELLSHNVDKIIILDNSPVKKAPDSFRTFYFNCDICNADMVNELFDLYEPDYVFHTAAQRNPGYAEMQIAETVNTNILGTLNIVLACERSSSVKQFVFSSTGKASRYYTEEVYAATKKLCEYIIAAHAEDSNVLYSIVRFTHIIENSLMNNEIKNACDQKDFVAIHSPGKYVTAQNVKEASSLMLNALIYVESGCCNFLIVRNLEWPVESLEVALYNIKSCGSSIPVVFTGNPSGYSEKFFRGQVNWTAPWEMNHLINVYEFNHHLALNPAGDLIISKIIPCDKKTLVSLINDLKQANGEVETKDCLFRGLANVVRSVLKNVPQSQTADILKWGLDKQWMEHEKTSIADYGQTIPILLESLGNGDAYKKINYIFEAVLPDDLLSSFKTELL